MKNILEIDVKASRKVEATEKTDFRTKEKVKDTSGKVVIVPEHYLLEVLVTEDVELSDGTKIQQSRIEKIKSDIDLPKALHLVEVDIFPVTSGSKVNIYYRVKSHHKPKKNV